MGSLIYIEKVKENQAAFELKVIDICSQLGIQPNWLMTVMNSESGLDHKFVSNDGYGLIQFAPETLVYLVYHLDDKRTKQKSLQNEAIQYVTTGTNVQQLDFVLQYLLPYKGSFNKFEDLYLIVFYPNADGIFAGTLKKPLTWLFPKSVTENNLDVWEESDGNISISSFRKWALEKAKSAGIADPGDTIDTPITGRQKQAVLSEKNKKAPEGRVLLDGYIVYIHTYSGMTSLDELIEYKFWQDFTRNEKPKAEDILNVYGNRQSVRDAYSKREKKDIAAGTEASNLVLGTKLKIPAKYVNAEFVAFDGSQIIIPNADTETFINQALARTVKGVEYRQVFKAGVGAGVVLKSTPKPRVWIWCKSLGFSNKPEAPKYSGEGQIFDLSPFIMNLQTGVSSTGGNFSFTLPPLTCECELDGWKIKTGTTSSFSESGKDSTFISKNVVHRKVGDVLKHNTFLFHNMIQENDIVFITLDDKTPTPKDFNLKISNTELPGKVFDMIGLIDGNSVSQNFTASSAMINISGRDFIKPMIEDSSYFLQLDESLTSEAENQKQGLFVNDNPANWGRPARSSMLSLTSNIVSTSSYQPRTVGEFIQFIFSALATIEICPDSLFKPYESQSDVEGFGISQYSFYDVQTNSVKLFKAAGIWQIIKLQIDPENVNDRYVVNTSFPTMSGSLLNAVKVFIDGTFIEMMSDTYLDQFFYVVRRPPYNRKSIYDYLSKLTNESVSLNVEAAQVVSDSIGWYSGEVYAWYRLNTNFTSYGKPINPYLSGKFMPIVFFREYCEIWGNKALDIQTNYQPFESIAPGREFQGGEDPYNTQVYEDLAFLVETNAYLPFTRNGTITIKQDRRIKRGIWFRYLPTGEIFYIDSVSHGYRIAGNSMEFNTTLQVSRGMVEYNDAGQEILPYYFKIIDGLPNQDIQKKPVTVTQEISDPFILDTFFDFNKASLIDLERTQSDLDYNDLQSTTSRTDLKNKSDKNLNNLLIDLRNDNSLKLILTGHTDEEGTPDYNQRLGKSRADGIKKLLVDRWNSLYIDPLDANRISTKSMGERQKSDTRDVSTVDLETKRQILANNRRVEVQYVKTKTTTPKEGTNNVGKKVNDYTKWSVNQEIFNFFLTRRQFCGKIEDLQNLGNYTKPKQPEDLNVIDSTATTKKQQAPKKTAQTQKKMVGKGSLNIQIDHVQKAESTSINNDKKVTPKFNKKDFTQGDIDSLTP